MTTTLWMRVGDVDDYHEFDTTEDVAQYLAEFYDIDHIDRFIQYGVKTEGFDGLNYISLFWGKSDNDAIYVVRELTKDELEEINESLEFYP